MCYGPEGNEAQLQRSTIAIPWFDVVRVLWAGLLSMALSPFFHGIPGSPMDLRPRRLPLGTAAPCPTTWER